MKTEFYKHIELESELDEIKKILDEGHIVYEVSSADVIIDKAIVGQGMFAKYTLKLLPSDFKKANKLISESFNQTDIRIEDFPHLKALTNDELIDVLKNPTEWSTEAEIVARKILENRDVSFTNAELSKLRDQKTLEQRKGKSVSTGIQVLCFLAITIGFYLGIIFTIGGIGMGYYFAYGTSRDIHGEKYFDYDEDARSTGKYILYGGLFCLVIQFGLLFMIDVF